MAGEWIKMRTNLWDDPRVAQLCELTDQAEATIVGGLYWLWATADEHSSNGLLPGMTVRTIDRKTAVAGLGKALVTIGWIVEGADGVTVTRFDEHNGASAKQRAQTAKRVSNCKANAKVTQDALPKQDEAVTGALPREEKIREEVNPTTPGGVVVASKAGNPPPGRPDRAPRPECPHQDIIALYHEILPECPQVRDWTPARSVQLRARWNEDPRRQNLDYWRKFFEYVKGCGFLVGRGTGTNGRPFVADLEWLTKSQNFVKIREGKYE